MEKPSVAVIGGGAAGLAAAWKLRHEGAHVTLFEASGRCGGVIRTRRAGDWLIEQGPNSMASPPDAVEAMLAALGLADRRVTAHPDARRRYVVAGGRPVALPAGPLGVLRTPLLSPRGRVALLAEPFRRRAPDDSPESVASFVRRRFGAEVLARLAGPMVSGVFAGDPERLSLRHAFPRLHAWETEHGSVLRGALSSARGGGPHRARSIHSFPGGLSELVDVLARELGPHIRLGARVAAIDRTESGWTVRCPDGAAEPFDAVVVAVPAHQAAWLVGEPGLAERLGEMPHAPVAVVSLGFHRASIAHPLDGFGALVAAEERSEVLGVIFTSTIFPERAPAGTALVTVMLGGARAPHAALAEPDDVAATALRGARAILGARGEPLLVDVQRWVPGIPQYDLRHETRLRAVERTERDRPGLAFAGSYLRGVSIGDTLASGLDAAARALAGARRLPQPIRG